MCAWVCVCVCVLVVVVVGGIVSLDPNPSGLAAARP